MDLEELKRIHPRRYAVTAYRQGRWWILEIPELHGRTRVRWLSDAAPGAQEWIAVALGLDVEDVEVALTVAHESAEQPGHG